MTDKRILIINDDGTAEVNGKEYVLVPKEALLWLHGEGDDFECPPERYFRGAPPAYWWRSVFRQKAAVIDLSGLPVVPDKFTDPNDDFEQMFADGWNQALDAMGVKG